MPLEKINVMVDLETLGSKPGCKIMSIGAVKFDVNGIGEKEEFYVIVKREGQTGLHIDAETISWWNKQDEKAKQILKDIIGDDAIPLVHALTRFNRFVQGSGKDVMVWGNGADFDNAILAVAFSTAKLNPFWKFWNNRCYRTLKNLYPQVPFVRGGTYHNALDDARSQAAHAVEIFKQMGKML